RRAADGNQRVAARGRTDTAGQLQTRSVLDHAQVGSDFDRGCVSPDDARITGTGDAWVVVVVGAAAQADHDGLSRLGCVVQGKRTFGQRATVEVENPDVALER